MGLFFSTKAHDAAVKGVADMALSHRSKADRAMNDIIDYSAKHNLAKKKRLTKNEKMMLELLNSNYEVWDAWAKVWEQKFEQICRRWGVWNHAHTVKN